MEENNFDVAIIGGGPGGYTAAIRAAQLGKKVALIEKQFLGGVCLNVGCIPTKALLSSTDALDIIKKAETFALHVEKVSFSLEKMIERKDKIVKDLRAGLEGLLLSNKIKIIKGHAKLLSKNEIEITGETTEKISAENIIIATGSYPTEVPNIKVDHKKVFNSNSLLCLKKQPKSIAIIGGGYIGCEFASFYARLGVKITIIEALPSILYSHGKDLAQLLTGSFKSEGIDLKVGMKVLKCIEVENGIELHLDNGEIIKSEIGLLAIGRKPLTKNLNLENLNIQLGKHSEIIVDDQMRTSEPNIFAIGDVIGKWMLAHTASHEALVAVDTIHGIENKMDFSAVPAIIFTKPEIAMVGVTPEKAKEQNLDVDTSKFPFTALGKAHALSEKKGFVNVVIDKKTKIIIGAQAIGPAASVLIAEMGLAITNKLTAKAVINTIHAHPTLPESWQEALLIALDRPINFPPNLKL
ncbi:MAG: Dihydrolipoyl dehydrogenase [Candidatus Anoxychlamydiales bacterium]|nr:Dihydrolipoyl dehydrogenase [Candidatus Anoxychlamydiales bacterium]